MNHGEDGRFLPGHTFYPGPPQAQAWDMIGSVRVERPRRPRPKGFYWWDYKAAKISGQRCPKCGSIGTRGSYLPSFMFYETRECALVENCPICGWEHLHIWGISGEPYTWHHNRTKNARRRKTDDVSEGQWRAGRERTANSPQVAEYRSGGRGTFQRLQDR